MFRVYPEIDPRLRPNSQFGLDLDTRRGGALVKGRKASVLILVTVS